MIDHRNPPPEVDGEAQVGSDGNVHVIPAEGPEHIDSEECWCEPQLLEDYTEQGGLKLYLHRGLQ